MLHKTYSVKEGETMFIDVEFYELADGTEPVRNFLESLEPKLKAKMFREIDLLMANGPDLRMPHSRSVEDGIFELRAKQGTDISRVLYFFFFGKKAILANGFIKKSQKTPQKELALAKKYRDDYCECQKKAGGKE